MSIRNLFFVLIFISFTAKAQSFFKDRLQSISYQKMNQVNLNKESNKSTTSDQNQKYDQRLSSEDFKNRNISSKKLNCQVKEFFQGGENKETVLVTLDPSDSHGSMVSINGKKFPRLSGFISLMEKEQRVFAVKYLQDQNSLVQSSGQYEVVKSGQYTQMMMIIPTQANELEGIEIQCEYLEK